jgi:hypothetical protein
MQARRSAEIWGQMRATKNEFGAKLGITQQQFELLAQSILANRLPALRQN